MTTTRTHEDWTIPTGLSPLGQAAAEAFIKYCEENDLMETAGVPVFYSPQEWSERGEEYGCNSELIVIHEGGDYAIAISMQHCMYRGGDDPYTHCEAMREQFGTLGLFAEACTGWYSAIYKI